MKNPKSEARISKQYRMTKILNLRNFTYELSAQKLL